MSGASNSQTTNKPSEDDWNMLDYFWNEKGDLTRWCDWEKFKAQYPNHPIVDAAARQDAASEAITLMIKGGLRG